MEEKNPDTKDKIVLPENLQREMIRFFLRASALKIAEKERTSEIDSQQTSPKSEGELKNG